MAGQRKPPTRGVGSGPYDYAWQRIRPTILKRDGYVCQINGPNCKGKATQVDHIVPLIEGGARLDPDNLRAACGTCNAGRGNARVASLTKALESPPPSTGTPSRDW